MPRVYIGFPDGSPPEVHELQNEPVRLERLVRQVVEGQEIGAQVLEFHVEVGRRRAYALVDGLDDFVKLKAVCRFFGVDSIKKVVGAEDAAKAIALEGLLREKYGNG
jgi:hypothetical protein